MRSSSILRWRVKRTPRTEETSLDETGEAMRLEPVYRLANAAARAVPLKSSATRELIALFLKLGCSAFGGPAAHIALMKDEVVARRRWMTEAEFLDLLGATNLLPGPNSTRMAIDIGLRRAGLK